MAQALESVLKSTLNLASPAQYPNTYYHKSPTSNFKLPPKQATMDPFSAEGELLNIHNYFHQGQFQEVIDFDTAGLSSENALPARVLSLRAQIALGQAQEVLADVQGENEPDLMAVAALAELKAGNESKALKMAEELAEEEPDNGNVQVLCGTVLQAVGKSEEALALLTQHESNCMLCLWDELWYLANS
jgi:tetratricopeptide (TPR) repeat protein